MPVVGKGKADACTSHDRQRRSGASRDGGDEISDLLDLFTFWEAQMKDSDQ